MCSLLPLALPAAAHDQEAAPAPWAVVRGFCGSDALKQPCAVRECAQLEHKDERRGRVVVVADRFFASSKKCSACGYKQEEMALPVRRWTCPACGAEHDHDLNTTISPRNMAASHGVGQWGGRRWSCPQECEEQAWAKQDVSFVSAWQEWISLKERADMLSPFFTSRLRLTLQDIFNRLYKIILFCNEVKVILLNFALIFFVFFFSLSPLRMFPLVSLTAEIHSDVALLQPEFLCEF